MGLGSVDTFSLAEARERARLQRQLLADGIDPIEARKQQDPAIALAKAQAVVFQDCAKEYIKAHRTGWKNAKHADQWRSTLETWVYPVIGKLGHQHRSRHESPRAADQRRARRCDLLGQPNGNGEPRPRSDRNGAGLGEGAQAP